MADTAWTQEAYSVLKKKVTIVMVVDFGTTGAPTLKTWNPGSGINASSYTTAPASANSLSPGGTAGVASITRNSQGNFTAALNFGSYQRLIGLRSTYSVPTTGTPAAPGIGIVTPAGGVDNPGKITSVNFVTLNGSLAATDPVSGEQGTFIFEFDDSAAT